jgi:methionine synthase II (cobalamin-independent)
MGPVETRENALTIAVTGIGSMPGTDSAEAARIVAGELDIPHLVELPARGPGGDMLGRTLALVSSATGEFAAETTPDGWRLAGGRSGGDLGRQMRRGVSWLAEDVDRMELELAGFTSRVKVQVTGPWTLAAGLEAVRGTKLVADAGACSDLAAALAEALAEHVAMIGRRIPGAQVVVQVDEPALPIVLAGHVRTPSGRGVLRVPEVPELVSRLAVVVDAARGAGAVLTAAHCCDRDVPFDVLRRAGFEAVAIDTELIGQSADEALGAWWDAGGVVVLGAVPSLDDPRLTSEHLARRVMGLWGRIGFGIADVGDRTWLSPACGLAGASPTWSREVGALMRAAARLLESAG